MSLPARHTPDYSLPYSTAVWEPPASRRLEYLRTQYALDYATYEAFVLQVEARARRYNHAKVLFSDVALVAFLYQRGWARALTNLTLDAQMWAQIDAGGLGFRLPLALDTWEGSE